MALELLGPTTSSTAANGITNTYHHDLESLFYVLIWICTIFKSPGVIRDSEELVRLIPMKWNQVRDVISIANEKRGHLQKRGEAIVQCFSEYFASFRPLFDEFYEALFPKLTEAREDFCSRISGVTHTQLIDIFERALCKEREEARKPENRVLKLKDPQGGKENMPLMNARKRIIDEDEDGYAPARQPAADYLTFATAPVLQFSNNHPTTRNDSINPYALPNIVEGRRKRGRYDQA